MAQFDRADTVAQFEKTIRARKLFSERASILVAVSGGLDSIVLLHLLHRLSTKWKWQLTVAHFNHQLRGRSSDADERLVRKTARGLNLRFVCEQGDVKSFSETNDISIEMAARKLRHEFLARTAKFFGIKTVALAHHADDQVELFFLRLFRGAGTDGLAGMKWKSPSPADSLITLVRPLLDQPKEILSRYVATAGIKFCEDASNESLDFERNRIRHELIPLLKKNYQPAVTRTTLRTMEIVAGESDLASKAALDWLGRKKRTSFAKLPVALQRRILRLQLLGRKVVAEFDLVEALRLNPGKFVSINEHGSVARGEGGEIRLRTSETTGFKSVKEGESFSLQGRRGEIILKQINISWAKVAGRSAQIKRKQHCEVFDADKVGETIVLRHWKAGDRFQPIGMKSPVKLQNFFTNLKIPRAERHARLVATTERGELFWVEGLRISERFKLDKQSRRRLKWNWKRHGWQVATRENQ